MLPVSDMGRLIVTWLQGCTLSLSFLICFHKLLTNFVSHLLGFVDLFVKECQ